MIIIIIVVVNTFVSVIVVVVLNVTAKDACLAAEKGVAGILVSNHGARQLDTVPATVSYKTEKAKVSP